VLCFWGIVKLFFLLILAGCGAAEIQLRNDGGTDSSNGFDASFDASADAGVCGPADVSGYTPVAMHSPNPAHANKCTSQQAMDYAACEGGASTKCGQFAMGQPSYTCGQCIESQKTDLHWGVIVFENSVGTPNAEGCVDDALGQVPYEHASGGSGSCGDLLHASYGCQEAACGACVTANSDVCLNAAIAGGCASYDQAVESTTGLCAVLMTDAAPAAAASCFPDPTITDLAAQRADYLTRMVEYMCGP
jgi:hypothetical protein